MKPVDQPIDERGQVLSSFVAVAAAIAVVIGLLVLFGTRDPDSDASGPPSSPPPTSAPSSGPTSQATSVPIPAPSSGTPRTSRTPAPPVTSTPVPTDEPAGEPTRSTDDEVVDRVPVEVYNNTSRRGLADRVADRARSQGWQVAGVDNWRGKVVTTTVYYPDGMRAAAEALATDLGIGRVKAALDNMKKDRLSVILTTDYAG